VALIAGGHTFGKAHGAHKPEECVGAEPAAAGLEEQGLGWKNRCGKGNAGDTVTSGLEGAWSVNPIAWTSQYLDNLFAFEWVQSRSPAGAIQWIPANGQAANLVPDAHDSKKRHAPIMFTTDLALKEDPAYRKIALNFKENPAAYQLAFAKAWYKLTHRDMGPRSRYLGPEVPKETLLWEDPLPERQYALISAADVSVLKTRILASGLSPQALIRTAWASASSYRGTDMRGGANGARIRLAPQKDWAINQPAELANVLVKLEAIQQQFNNAKVGGKQVSLADLIVLGGNAAIEQAAKQGGHKLQLPFAPGRVDASQAQTDVSSFAELEPVADGFRNYYGEKATMSPITALIDKANMLTLTVPEMTVLVGGLRALDAGTDGTGQGVLTSKPGTLSNDFFVNLLSMDTLWSKSATKPSLYEGKDRTTGRLKWTASPVDLAFGSSSELRAIAEVYAAADGHEQFVQDFASAWTKVMNLDRFDLKTK
jgi:catalase-peroxidase